MRIRIQLVIHCITIIVLIVVHLCLGSFEYIDSLCKQTPSAETSTRTNSQRTILVTDNQHGIGQQPLQPLHSSQPPGLLVENSHPASMMNELAKAYPEYKTIDNKKKIVVQFDDRLDCNGAYLELKDKDQFSSSTNQQGMQIRPDSIMFGLDKCGVDARLHFIMQYLNPKTNKYEEKHWKSAQQVSGLINSENEVDLFDGTFIEQKNNPLSLYETKLITSDKEGDQTSAIQYVGPNGFCALNTVNNGQSSDPDRIILPSRGLLPSPSDTQDLPKTDRKSYYQQQFLIDTDNKGTEFPYVLRRYWMEVTALCILSAIAMNYIHSILKPRFWRPAQAGIQNDVEIDSLIAPPGSSDHPKSGLEPRKSIAAGPNVNGEGIIQIGKIEFDPKLHLGSGCRGTCVFQGTFESKQVCAVKRVLSQYVTLAGREIEFLRSLQHPNLVRYLATEEDAQFIYIALELAELTLADLLESSKGINMQIVGISKPELCRQSALGLSHLHTLDIVHRDIKPQNILISFPLPPSNERKVMISDFGVSKQLDNNDSTYTSSASRFLDGTQGWVAPEIVNFKLENSKKLRPSKSADIFALGCVFYYIFSGGAHPYGDLLDRQVNISKGNFELKLGSQQSDDGMIEKGCDEESATHLIESMISPKLEERPPIEAVLNYPLFWTKTRQLQFLVDVSDRIEKATKNNDLVCRLESGRSDITDFDWTKKVCPGLKADLRKHRSYNEYSIHDLLRAIRNKKNHYYELGDDLKKSLGDIPEQYLDYFTGRFPKLLPHVYIAVQIARKESQFQPYYAKERKISFADGDKISSKKITDNGECNGNSFVWPDLRRSWRVGQSPRRKTTKFAK